jgi:U3 small nucleolar RNA-associated protein 25
MTANLSTTYRNVETANGDVSLSQLQSELLSVLSSYRDLYYPERTHENGEQLRLVYVLHALNHVLKTRTKILNNNAKISAAKSGGKDNSDGVEYRDQGLTRTKVLIVVPFRESARRVVDLMGTLLFGKGKKGNVANRYANALFAFVISCLRGISKS